MLALGPDHAKEVTAATHSARLLWAVLVPVLGAFLVHWARSRRGPVAVVVSLITLGLVVSIWPLVTHGPVEYSLPGVLGVGLGMRADLFGYTLALVTAAVWLLATVFSVVYMDHEHAQGRYYPFFILTLGATVGVFLSRDLFTLFVFFEVMTVAAYVLVVHEESGPALRAGNVYLYMSIAGGLCLLFGVFLLAGAAGTTVLEPLLEQVVAAGINPAVIAGLLVVGFGVKAGMVPLHIWLPQAHPVAPSPASALLSGIMIKTGAYGIMRTMLTVLRPASEGKELWHFTESLGLLVLWVGLATMATGAVLAALQDNAKRILAYSSISQMGYILTGAGVAAYLGPEGGMGFCGALYHMVNHAFFKSGLFMMVGTVYLATHELRLSRLGGLRRYLPVTAAAVLVAAGGITGMPAFNGYASKTLIHDALIEAYHHHHGFVDWLAERTFTVASAVTAVYFIKLFRGIFLGGRADADHTPGPEAGLSRAVLVAFMGVIVAVGAVPNLLLERVLVPAAYGQGFHGEAMHHLEHFHFWDWHPVSAVLLSLGLGILMYAAAHRFDLLRLRYSPWLSVEGLVYLPVIRLLAAVDRGCERTLDRGVDNAYCRLAAVLGETMRRVGLFDQALDEGYLRVGDTSRSAVDRMLGVEAAVGGAYDELADASRGVVQTAARVDRRLDQSYEEAARASRSAVAGAARADRQLDRSYEEAAQAAGAGARRPSPLLSLFGSANMSANALVVATMLMTLLFVLVLYGVMRW